MDERTKQVLVGIIVAVIFIASVSLIIIGQKNIGPQLEMSAKHVTAVPLFLYVTRHT